MIIAQDAQGEIDQSVIAEQKKRFSRDRQQGQKTSLEHLSTILHPDTVRKIHIAQETGASNWLTSLPIRAKGFNLNKQEFVDAVCSEVRLASEGLPNTCGVDPPTAQTTHDVQKGDSCVSRHDEVRDLTASMLKEVCHDVSTEPTLLPLDGELLRTGQPIPPLRLRVDICARGFWTRGQRTFLGHRVFDPMAASHRELSLGLSTTGTSWRRQGLWR
ncbi:hypothetical protein GWK47_048108 [Chionoecetes opilio]|uniref:Uncharacterized protein n=1 Tax=Chionoecetes opilio TaxID=41210 RepID=A0A8J4Y4N2_CHIOP|nr:hypothetical protein GWK47_048108 [Chionoecetes opilio]